MPGKLQDTGITFTWSMHTKIPVFISSNHSCVDCLESGPCTHLCCYKWQINLGTKSGLVECSGENLKLKVDAAVKHTESCTLSTSDSICSVSEVLSRASGSRKRPLVYNGSGHQPNCQKT